MNGWGAGLSEEEFLAGADSSASVGVCFEVEAALFFNWLGRTSRAGEKRVIGGSSGWRTGSKTLKMGTDTIE